MESQVFTPVDPDEMFSAPSKTYVHAPLNKLLKFHAVQPEKTTQINTYKTKPDGSPNPDYDKPQPMLIFKAMLDSDVPGKGQIYNAWITGYYDQDGKECYSFGDRSKFGAIAAALAGSVASFHKLKTSDWVGMPFQASLQANKKDPENGRQLLNINKIMPPAEDQSRFVPVDGLTTNTSDFAAEFDKALEEAEVA